MQYSYGHGLASKALVGGVGGGLCVYRVSSLALAKSLTIKPSEKSVGTINSFPLINRLT